jgi:hypothetical protein
MLVDVILVGMMEVSVVEVAELIRSPWRMAI